MSGRIIHYRHDGRPRRTLCGLRIATDGKPRTKPVYHTGPGGEREQIGVTHLDTTPVQPRKLSRTITWVPSVDPLLVRALSETGYTVDCPHCLAAAAEEIERAKLKAAQQPPPRYRYYEDGPRMNAPVEGTHT